MLKTAPKGLAGVFSTALFEEMCNKEHWQRTYDRMSKKDTIDKDGFDWMFSIVESDERIELSKQICTGDYAWSLPEKVEIAKAGTTKKRVVYMYNVKDRFLLGVMYRAMSVVFDDRMVDNCFSYKRGVSTNSAILYIDKMKKNTGMYGLKLDISAYFNSVSKEHLTKSVDELLPQGESARLSLDKILFDDRATFKGSIIDEYKALIPGCALGSFFANYCLRELDIMFRDRGVIYARYSDDIIILDETPEKINEHLAIISDYLKSVGLTINPNKYVHFLPTDSVEYLGLALSDDGIDISEHSKRKMKKTIKRWAKEGRKQIEMDGLSYEYVARRLVKRLNYKLYKSYVVDKTKFGWGMYAFRYITVTDSMTELDFYLRDTLRYLKTGKYNKANVKAVSEEQLKSLGVVSFYEMYKLFREDFDYYCEIAYLL